MPSSPGGSKNVRRQSPPNTRNLPEHAEEAVVGKQGQMDELEEEKKNGKEKRTDTFLSFLESAIPGTVWQTYVHVQNNRRIARSRASKRKRAGCIFRSVILFAQVWW